MSNEVAPMSRPKLIAATLGVIAFLALGGLGLTFGCKAYNRYQRRQDVANEVSVTKTKIQVAQQEARVAAAQIQATKAEAKKRYQEAIGLRRAQQEIQKTLTPLYIQHEAIQAQLAMAKSENHTIIWAPAGANGVPIVTDPLAESRAAQGAER